LHFVLGPISSRDRDWMEQGCVESVWKTLSPDQRRETNRDQVLECVRTQVDRLRGSGGPPNAIIVGRTESGDPAGFVWVSINRSSFTCRREAIILMLFVQRPYRRKGLGGKLVKAAEDWARRKGVERIGLNVGVRNIPADTLYERLGYERLSTIRSKRL